MKTTTVPEIVSHTFIDNHASLIEKYYPILVRKKYLFEVKPKEYKTGHVNLVLI